MKRQGCRRLLPGGAGLALAVVVCLSGCGFEIEPGAGRIGDDPEPDAPAAGDVVTVRFRVFTAQEAVDVEFFATNDPLEVIPGDLFVPANAFSASVGLAGTGIVPPLSEDVILFPCSPTLTLGTTGGTFLDSETGEPRGTGVARWASEGPLGLCGAIVTFEFAGAEDARTTVLTIGN